MSISETDTERTEPEPEIPPELGGDLFAFMPDPAVVVGRSDLRVLAANRAAGRLIESGDVGIDPLVGCPLADILVEPPDPLGSSIKLAVGGLGLPLKLRCRSGEVTEFHVSVSVGPRDGPACWILSFSTATDGDDEFAKLNDQLHLETEQALRRQRKRLAESNSELEAAQSELRARNLDLQHFAHIAAHDLREPCRRQITLVNSVRADLGDDAEPEIQRQLDMVQRQGQEMLDLIDGFRMLSNLTGPDIARTDVALADIVAEVISHRLPDGEQASVTAELPPTVPGYEPLIRTLFDHLITNAVQHGRRPLHLSLSVNSDEDRFVYRLQNNAEVEPDQSQDLLRPLVRGASRAAGIGLGLSVCARCVQHHGGHIWIARTDGMFAVNFTLERQIT